MTNPLYIQARKEVRALLPWWLGVAVTTVTMALVATGTSRHFGPQLQTWFVLAYATGVLAIAALSVGHEFTHGTLPFLLVQPVDRLRVLWTKLAVLAVMVGSLAAVGQLLFPNWYFPMGVAARPLTVWGPPALAIGLVPLLTSLTRKPLAGAIFSVLIPGGILSVSERFYSLRDGTQALSITFIGTLIASACGLLALFYAFPRLQTPGDERALASPFSRARERSSDTPAAPVSVPVARRHWAWMSIRKELRLQQLTFAVSALFALACAVVLVLQRWNPLYVGPTTGAIAALHGVFIAIIAGSQASAEERHLGTLAPQVLLPKAAWRQWMVKTFVTIGLALALAWLLPLLFSMASPPNDSWALESEYFVGIAFVGLAALYVSSVSSNSLWALLSCFPAAAVVLFVGGMMNTALFVLTRGFDVPLDSGITDAMRQNHLDPSWTAWLDDRHLLGNILEWFTIALLVGLVLLVFHFASHNHRSLDRKGGTVARQVGVMILYVAAATVALTAMRPLVWSLIR